MKKMVSDPIPEKQILVASPHFDDTPLCFGGYFHHLKTTGLINHHRIKILLIFSRSNYQARDDEGNADLSLKRVQYATGIRLLEDTLCLDDLLGKGQYRYELGNEAECIYREYTFEKGEAMEFPKGNLSTFTEKDWEIYHRLVHQFSEILQEDDTAILIPLGVKEHVDHVMTRDAVLEAAKMIGSQAKAQIYLGEDMPYTGMATSEDWEVTHRFLESIQYDILDYAINIDRKVQLVMEHYPTQVEPHYKEGTWNRAQELKTLNQSNEPMERLYRFKGLS